MLTGKSAFGLGAVLGLGVGDATGVGGAVDAVGLDVGPWPVSGCDPPHAIRRKANTAADRLVIVAN